MAEKLQGPTWTHIWTILSILITMVAFFITGLYLYVDEQFKAHAQVEAINDRLYEREKQVFNERLQRMEERNKERFAEIRENLSVLSFKIGQTEQAVQKTNQNVIKELQEIKRRMPKQP